jgi:hypothetical protein
MDNEFLIEKEAAAFLRVSPRSLQRWRTTGGGPEFTRLGGKRIGYRRSVLAAWTAGKTFASTSEEQARVA